LGCAEPNLWLERIPCGRLMRVLAVAQVAKLPQLQRKRVRRKACLLEQAAA
jgi:hypothetical protein